MSDEHEQRIACIIDRFERASIFAERAARLALQRERHQWPVVKDLLRERESHQRRLAEQLKDGAK